MSRQASKLAAACLAAALAATALSAAALAEIDQEGNLRVNFNGSIAPQKLPRAGSAPVGVQLGGKIATTDKSTPPKLERIILEINSHGRLQNRGLPRCPLAKLNSLSSAGARRVCSQALVGRGSVTSRVSLPGQGAFASNGALLAFNGRYRGRTAVFAHVATTGTLPLTYVIIFQVSKRGGSFATRLLGELPPIASEYGYISAFNMNLRRTYRYRGARLSYASAGCPAPKGFSGATFPLAKASYEFADGRRLSSTLNRQCKVRG